MAVIVGILAGMASALPMLVVLRSAARNEAQSDFGRVLVCALLPFMVLQLVMLAVYLLRPADLLGFGTAASLTFLAAVVVGGLRAWHLME